MNYSGKNNICIFKYYSFRPIVRKLSGKNINQRF